MVSTGIRAAHGMAMMPEPSLWPWFVAIVVAFLARSLMTLAFMHMRGGRMRQPKVDDNCCHSQTTYTAMRNAAAPRFLPLTGPYDGAV